MQLLFVALYLRKEVSVRFLVEEFAINNVIAEKRSKQMDRTAYRRREGYVGLRRRVSDCVWYLEDRLVGRRLVVLLMARKCC